MGPGLIRSALAASLLVVVSALPGSAQELMPPAASGWTAWSPRAESAPACDVTQTSSGYTLHISGNQVPNVYGGWRTRIQGLQGGRFYRFRAHAVALDIASLRESVTIVLRWRGSFGDEVAPDYVWDYRPQSDGSLLFDRTIQSPAGTTAVDVDLVLQWSAVGRLSFDALSFTSAAAPAARPVRVAAVHFRPSGASSGLESVRQAAQYAGQVASTYRPDVMVLGETLNVVGAPGTFDAKAETVPGPSTDVVAAVARSYGVYIAFGILERAGTLLYNTAVLLDRSGTIVGKYRKVQLPLSEASAGVSPGSAISVIQTEFGRVALLVCQDTSFPEPAREAAMGGAEILLVPIWGGKPALLRARAAEHGIYVAAAGYDYASEVVGPLGTTLAGVTSVSSAGAAVANIDLSARTRELWLGDMRDISNKERRAAPYQRGVDAPPDSDAPPPPPPPDTTPPSVALTSPASGAAVSGAVTVTATASDNTGVARVLFFVDGTQLGAEDTTAPYSASWDTRTTTNGSHTVSATAYDAAGNSASSSATVTVSNGAAARPIPGTIQAEDYDAGGEGVGYHDTSAGNSGGQYRSDNVDIEATTDTGGGYDVGWIAVGEWLRYTVSVQAAGKYTLTARVAASGAGGTFHVEVGGANVTGALTIPNTGGWQAWTDVKATVTLAAGVQAMRVVFDAAGAGGVVGNLNYVRLDAVPAGWAIPGTIQSEDYDAGGEGVGYHDVSAGNTGGQYRTDAVDIERTTDVGGGYDVGWIEAREWLQYTVAIQTAGAYKLTARVAANGVGGTFHVEVAGVNVTGPLAIPNTGGWQAWTDVTASVTLPAGVQPMRVVFDAAGPTGVIGNINYVKISAP